MNLEPAGPIARSFRITQLLHVTISGTKRVLAHQYVRSSIDPLTLVPIREVATADRDLVSAGLSMALIAGHLGRLTMGFLLLLLGIVLTLTLWLMPVGLPLALLGIALVAAPSDCRPL
jgi:hypothetical protein